MKFDAKGKRLENMKEIEWLLIDGYNLLHSRKEKIADIEIIEDEREKLIQEILEYSGYHFFKTIIVFDGKGTKVDWDVRSEFLQVVYTVSQETADQWIEKKTFELIKEGWIVKVVTSDFAEQQVTFGSGALRIPVREMNLELMMLPTEIKKITEDKDSRMSREEISDRLNLEIRQKLEEIRFQKTETRDS